MQNKNPQSLVELAQSECSFGALMTEASRQWNSHLLSEGYPAGGEFTVGPCRIVALGWLRQLETLMGKSVKDAVTCSCGGFTTSQPFFETEGFCRRCTICGFSTEGGATQEQADAAFNAGYCEVEDWLEEL